MIDIKRKSSALLVIRKIKIKTKYKALSDAQKLQGLKIPRVGQVAHSEHTLCLQWVFKWVKSFLKEI